MRAAQHRLPSHTPVLPQAATDRRSSGGALAAQRARLCLDRAAAVVLFLALPLALAPGLFFFFDVTPKAVLLFAGTALAMGSLAIHPPQRNAFRLTRAGALFFGLFAASLVVSTARSSEMIVSIVGSDWRRFGMAAELAFCPVAFWFWLRLQADSRFGMFCLTLLCAAGLVASSYGLAQFLGFDPFLDAKYYQTDLRPGIITRPPSTFGHAIYFANFCLLAIGGGLALARTAGPAARRYLGYATAILASAGMLTTDTRAALLGAIVGILAVAAVAKTRFRRWVTAGLIGVPVLAASFIWLGTAAGYKNRLLRDTGGSRLLLWRDSSRMALHGGLFGFGPEIFAREAPKFRGDDTAATFPDNYDESPHNIFLDSWVAGGMVGLVGLIGIISLGMIALARRSHVQPTFGRPLFGAFAAAVFSQQFSCFVLPTAIGLLVITMVGLRAREEGTTAELGSPKSRWIWRSVLVPLAAIAVFAAAMVGIPDFERGRLPRLISEGKLKEGIEVYRAGSFGNPPGTAADLWFCRRMNEVFRRSADAGVKAEAYRASMAAAARATRDADSPSLGYYEMSTLHASAGDLNAAERELHDALDWSPKWYRAHWALAEILAVEGRDAERRAEAEKALQYCTQTNKDYVAIIAKLRELASAGAH